MPKYCDLNSAFKTNYANNKSTITDIEDVRKSLERLFMTGKGEVPFNREYGTNLKTLLFENNVDASDIRMFLYMDIQTWEPRVSLNPADLSIEKVNEHMYVVYCNFTVPTLNNASGSLQTTLTDD